MNHIIYSCHDERRKEDSFWHTKASKKLPIKTLVCHLEILLSVEKRETDKLERENI
jgi:hypothetical protein